MLAFTDDADIEKFSDIPLKKYTDNTIDSLEALKEDLKNIREQGYSVDNEEQEIGLFCIGAPILDKNGNAIASISISGPTARMKNKDIDEKISRLVEIAREISLEVQQIR